MGMSHSTYVFYGVLVARHDNAEGEPNSYTVHMGLYERFGEDTDRVTEDVSWFMAGDYDRNDLYLVVRGGALPLGVEPGQVRFFPHGEDVGNPQAWNDSLVRALVLADVEPLSRFGWFVVPDVG